MLYIGGTFTVDVHAPLVVPTVIVPPHVEVGAILSVLVTVKVQFAELPAASVTVMVTVVVPIVV
jgi:hypothetical protein